jgi:hypothetical protein
VIHASKFKTVTQLHDRMTHRLAYSSAEELDFWSTVDVHFCNVMLRAESFDFQFDLKDLWLTHSRWTTLARQYINPHALDSWLDLIEDRMSRGGKQSRGMALMRTNQVQPRTKQKKVSRRWGSCMLAISFRRQPEPQITLYSRTSYFGYLAALDITVAQTCARLISERIGVAVEDMSFVWMMEDAQFSFKSMAYLFNNPEYSADLESCNVDDKTEQLNHPGLFLSAKWFDTFRKEDENGVLYGDMTWGACRRIRRRWHTEVFGYEYGEQFEGGTLTDSQSKRFQPLISVPSNTLTFDCLDRIRRKTDPAESEGFVEDNPEA